MTKVAGVDSLHQIEISMQVTTRSRLVRRTLPRLAGTLALAGLVAACMHRAQSADLDYSHDRLSEQGKFRVSYTSDTTPIPINRMHTWTVHVETQGRPVTDAAINIDGDMPGHGHGLPTRPQVTQERPDGAYLIEGMKFSMPGWWEIKLAIDSPEGADKVTFNTVVSEPGASR
jgi:hypothetical protein